MPRAAACATRRSRSHSVALVRAWPGVRSTFDDEVAQAPGQRSGQGLVVDHRRSIGARIDLVAEGTAADLGIGGHLVYQPAASAPRARDGLLESDYRENVHATPLARPVRPWLSCLLYAKNGGSRAAGAPCHAEPRSPSVRPPLPADPGTDQRARSHPARDRPARRSTTAGPSSPHLTQGVLAGMKHVFQTAGRS